MKWAFYALLCLIGAGLTANPWFAFFAVTFALVPICKAFVFAATMEEK